jgi:hypothetical protein
MRLLTLSNEGILDLITSMEKDTKAIKDNILRICWYMRGSISYDDGMMLSNQDIVIINKIIKDNIETTEKTKLPFF